MIEDLRYCLWRRIAVWERPTMARLESDILPPTPVHTLRLAYSASRIRSENGAAGVNYTVYASYQ